MEADHDLPPAGVLTTMFVRVADGTTAQRAAINVSSSNRFDIAGREYDADAVFDAQTSELDDLFHSMMGDDPDTSDGSRPAPLLALVEDYVSSCIVITGTHGSNCREVFQGADDDDGDEGLIGWIMEPTFALLNDKGFHYGGYYKYAVYLSFFEIYDEVISDLLQPDSDDLSVRFDARRGFAPHDLARRHVTKPGDAHAIIAAGKRCRRRERLPTGPAQHSASAVLLLNVVQLEGESPEAAAMLPSTIAIVQTPGTNALAVPVDQLVLRQGPTLHRSLLTLADVCKALASNDPQAMRYAPFLQSKLTQALQDYVGGAALVFCLVCLVRSDDDGASMATMAMARNLQRAVHYPVSNTELVQGLLLKNRYLLANALEERAARAVAPAAEAGSEELDANMRAKLREVEEELMQAKTDLATAREDNVTVYEMLDTFKQKHAELADAKAAQSKDLVAAEQGRIEAARALLDLKLELSRLQEQQETENYEAASELLAAKNHICELEAMLQEAEEARDKSATEAEVLLEQAREVKKDCTAALEQAKTSKAALDDERAKGLDMAAELVTLANQKSVLQEMRAGLEKQARELSDKLVAAERDMKAAQADLLGAREAALQEKSRAEAAELQVQRAQLAKERDALEEDSRAFTGVNTREAAMLQQQTRLADELAELCEAESRSRAALAAAKTQSRNAQRQAAALNQELQRRNADLMEAAKGQSEAREQLASLTARFRKHLADIAGPDSGSASKGSAPPPPPPARALSELVRTWRDREAQLESETAELRQQKAAAVRACRGALDALSAMRDAAEDRSLEGAAPLPPLPSEAELLAQAGVEDPLPMDEPDSTAERLRKTQSDLAAQQESNVAAVQQYQASLDTAWGQLREANQSLSLLKQENTAIKAELESARDGTALRRLEETQRALMEQLTGDVKIAKGGGRRGNGQQPPETPPEHAHHGGNTKQLQLLLARAEAERDDALLRLHAAKRSAKDGGGGAGRVDGAALRALQAQLRAAEGRAAALLSRNAALAAEVESYRAYAARAAATRLAQADGGGGAMTPAPLPRRADGYA